MTKTKRRPVRAVAKITRKWDGFCPKCGRGADGFGEWIWCDCGATTMAKSKSKEKRKHKTFEEALAEACPSPPEKLLWRVTRFQSDDAGNEVAVKSWLVLDEEEEVRRAFSNGGQLVRYAYELAKLQTVEQVCAEINNYERVRDTLPPWQRWER